MAIGVQPVVLLRLFLAMAALLAAAGAGGAVGAAASDDWRPLGSVLGVQTWVKPDDPVTKTKAVKGSKTFASVHISSILGVFDDASVAPRWVDMLSTMTELEFEQQQCTSESAFVAAVSSVSASASADGGAGGQLHKDVSVVHQTFAFPWPIAPRDFVMLRQFDYDREAKEVRVYYESVTDARLPHSDKTIRAHNVYSKFFFKALPDGRGTYVEVETQVDLKGTLPSMVINQVQKFWPSLTLSALGKLTKAGTVPPLARVADW